MVSIRQHVCGNMQASPPTFPAVNAYVHVQAQRERHKLERQARKQAKRAEKQARKDAKRARRL